MEQYKPSFVDTMKKDIFKEILGQSKVKEQVRSALLMGRHVVLIGPPGVGKTTLVKNLSSALPEIELNDCGFHCSPDNPVCPNCLNAKTKVPTKKLSGKERLVRVQGSPDLTAEDLLGDIDPAKALKYGPLSVEAFTPGKIFKANNGILFFDEINRASEKLQNALLQVLEEGKVTIGSYDIDFDANLIFIGTMNPDDNSTEPLSDVFLDRFDLITMGYPETQEIEEEIVKTKSKNLVSVPDEITSALVNFVRTLRTDDRLEKAPSVRASLGLYEISQSNAFLAGRDEVTFEDLGKAIDSVIPHRLRLKPSTGFLVTPEKFVRELYQKTLDELGHQQKGGDR